MNYARLLTMLRNHPRTFLQTHYLKITVLQNAIFGQAQYYFGGRLDNGIPGQQPQRRGVGLLTRGSKILNFMPQDLRFQLAPGDNPLVPIPPTNVWLVPAQFADTVPDFTDMAGGLVTGGPDLMITTLLNGCSFCCADSPGGVLMKHIQPRGAFNHVVLGDTVDLNGAFNGETPGTFRFFGSGHHGYDEGTDDVTIIGVRRGGNWAVYAQVHQRQVNNIRRVVRFFPD